MLDAFTEWQQQGEVYFWRFEPQKRGLAGWHFAADAAGKASMIALLEALPMSGYAAKRTVRISEPPAHISTSPMAPSYGRKIVSPEALRVIFRRDWPDDGWEVSTDGSRVALSLGRESMAQMAQAVRSAQGGDFDFSIGPWDRDPPQNIWFW